MLYAQALSKLPWKMMTKHQPHLGDPREVGGDVDFTIEMNNQTVYCRISAEALADHFDLDSHKNPVKSYVANCETIQDRAVKNAQSSPNAGATRRDPLVIKTADF
mgnify:CR=1 FL=1